MIEFLFKAKGLRLQQFARMGSSSKARDRVLEKNGEPVAIAHPTLENMRAGTFPTYAIPRKIFTGQQETNLTFLWANLNLTLCAHLEG